MTLQILDLFMLFKNDITLLESNLDAILSLNPRVFPFLSMFDNILTALIFLQRSKSIVLKLILSLICVRQRGMDGWMGGLVREGTNVRGRQILLNSRKMSRCESMTDGPKEYLGGNWR